MNDKIILEEIKKQLIKDKILEPYYYFVTPNDLEEGKEKVKEKGYIYGKPIIPKIL